MLCVCCQGDLDAHSICNRCGSDNTTWRQESGTGFGSWFLGLPPLHYALLVLLYLTGLSTAGLGLLIIHPLDGTYVVLLASSLLAVILISIFAIWLVYKARFGLREHKLLRLVVSTKRPSLTMIKLGLLAMSIVVFLLLGSVLWWALTYAVGGNEETYIMNADGSNLTDLTNNPAKDFTPNWSLDGAKVVFASDRDGNWEIYSMRADGGEIRRLTDSAAKDYNPSWSPDGERIAFASDRDGNWEIYTMNPDGGDIQRLTNNTIRDYDPSWSPDGTHILFASGGKAFLMLADDLMGRTQKLFLPLYLAFQLITLSGFAFTLGLILVDSYIDNLNNNPNIPQPIYMDMDQLQAMVLRSLRRSQNISNIEPLPITSLERMSTGGIRVTFSREVEVERRDEEKAEIIKERREKRYKVESDRWGRIVSLDTELT